MRLWEVPRAAACHGLPRASARVRLVSPATLATLDAAAAGDNCRAAVALSAGAVPPLCAASTAPASGPCPTATLELDAAAVVDSCRAVAFFPLRPSYAGPSDCSSFTRGC